MANEVRGIVLDFDGVILESNQIKGQAFRRLFAQYPEHGDKIVKLHMEHGGMSRFEKFRIIHRDIIKKPIDHMEEMRLSSEFNKLTEKQLMICPFSPGALGFLELYARKLDLFIASGTPEQELRELIHRRELSKFFNGVFGSPKQKNEILGNILSQNDWDPRQIVFVGDAIDDYIGAKKVSVPFIGRVPSGSRNPFEKLDVHCIVSDLEDLSLRWDTVVAEL